MDRFPGARRPARRATGAGIAAALVAALAPSVGRADVVLSRVTTGAIVTDGGTTFGHGWGDADGDGDPDLLVCNMASGQVNFFYRNEGGGTFARLLGSELEEGGPSASPAWADYDGDGDLDLFVANGGTTGAAHDFLYRNDGGTFARITTGGIVTQNRASTAASWADFDGDGDLDLFVGRTGGPNHFFTNDGDGTFTPGGFPDAGGTWGVAFADYDDDGDPDFFCANWNLTNSLYRNDGPDGYVLLATGPVGTGVALSLGGSWGDMDGDADLDLYVTETQGPNRLFRNDGGGDLAEITAGPAVTDVDLSESSAWADLDQDGDLDLPISGGGNVAAGTNVLYEGDGAGGFSRVASGDFVDGTARTEALSAIDVDGDGDLDLFLSSWTGDNQLYRNDPTSGAWLELALTGSPANTDALGARVVLRARIGGNDRLLVRRKTSQTGHVAQGDLPLHFGLGDATAVDSLTVRWPSGLVETLTDLAVNQALSWTEGAATGVGSPAARLPEPWRVRARPSPTSEGASIRMEVPRAGSLRVAVFDLQGRKVAGLGEREVVSGAASVAWDGRDERGRLVSSGVYFLRATLTSPGGPTLAGAGSVQVLR